MKTKLTLFTLCLNLYLPDLSHAAEPRLIASSGPGSVRLLELYTSESCSSCPPADQWVTGLKNNSQLWKQFGAGGFHVDYWNHLGWKDKLSSAELTKRQVDYSHQLGSANVYTPEMVLSGKEWTSWRSSKEPERGPLGQDNQKITLQILSHGPGRFLIKASHLEDQKKYLIRFAKLGMNLESTVTSGENSGRLLKHDFVVLDLQTKSANNAESEIEFRLKSNSPSSNQTAVSAWIEEVGNLTPLQSVGNYL